MTNFLDSVNPMVWLFLIGLAVGVFLEVIAVFLTHLMFKSIKNRQAPVQQSIRQPKSRPEPRPRQEPVRQEPVRQELPRQPRTGSTVTINRSQSPQPVVKPSPVYVPPFQPTLPKPRPPSVLDPEPEPKLEPEQLPQRRLRYLYYVEGYDAPFTTVQQALNAIGKQASSNISYRQLGSDVRAQIRREVVSG